MRKIIKKRIFIFLLYAVTTTYIYSQSGWLPMQTGFSNNFYSVHFENGITGWLCGSGGKILRTSDGGYHWQSQNTSTGVNLRSIKFVSAEIGVVCGDNGTILRTANGGNTWSTIFSGTPNALRCLFFINQSTGWIVGDGGKILKTTNSGGSWFSQQSGVTSTLNSVQFISQVTGWAVGSGGKILRTTNGGSTWTVNIDLGSIATLHSVCFTDSQNGYVAGDYVTSQGSRFVFFYKTVTGGEWWLYQFSGVNNIMRSVYFTNPMKGWAAGDSGVILGTTNGGENWIGQPSHTTKNLNAMQFTSPLLGWISGNNGTVLKTVNGGSFDTLNTSRRDLGVIPLVINSSVVPDAKYRIMFRAPDTSYNIMRSLNNGVSFDTIFSHLPLSDTGKAFDGLLVRVKKIRFDAAGGQYIGNAGVIKDPVNSADTIQTRQYGWDYNPPQNRNLEGGKFNIVGSFRPWQSVSMSLSYPTRSTFIGFGSLLKPEDLRKVKIVFTGYGSGQMAYRYVRMSFTSFQYQDMRLVPFKVYEVEPYDGTPSPRQLNCAFLEYNDSTALPDGMWAPKVDSTGGKDILYIFSSNYNPNPDPFYTTKNLFLQQQLIDIMYTWNAKLIQQGPAYQVNDELIIYPYTVTRPDLAPGYPLFYEFQTFSLIGVKKISNELPHSFMLKQNYPNPFNPKTKIKFSIPKVNANGISDVNLTVYDVLGKEVTVLLRERLLPGEYETEFDGSNLSSGVYFYRLKVLQAGSSTDNYIETKKMVLIK